MSLGNFSIYARSGIETVSLEWMALYHFWRGGEGCEGEGYARIRTHREARPKLAAPAQQALYNTSFTKTLPPGSVYRDSKTA